MDVSLLDCVPFLIVEKIQTLDTQYTVGIAGGVPVTFISVGADNQDDIDGFMDIINFLAAERNPPQVLSTSYGFDEPDVPPSVATLVPALILHNLVQELI